MGDLLMPDSETPRRAPSIIIATPSAGLWRESMGVCAVGMAGLTGSAGIKVDAIGATGAYTESNRNNIVKAVLERSKLGPIDGILWVDSDMKFPPDALLRLMARRVDICGAIYRERQEPYRFLGCFLDDDDGHVRLFYHVLEEVRGCRHVLHLGDYLIVQFQVRFKFA